jgi:hypothetical protein
MNMEYEEHVRKSNRRRVQEADAARPAVTGALPYFGHRPKAKDERKRLALLVREARRRHTPTFRPK